MGDLCSVCGLDGWFRVASNATQRLRQKFAENPVRSSRAPSAAKQIASQTISMSRKDYQLLRWFVIVLAWNAADGHL